MASCSAVSPVESAMDPGETITSGKYVNDSIGDYTILPDFCIYSNTMTFNFVPSYKPAYVITHYQMDTGPQMNVYMAKGTNGVFTLKLTNFTTNSYVKYNFTYEKNGAQYDTAPTGYPNTNGYTIWFQGWNYPDQKQAQIYFSCNGKECNYVIAHYAIGNGAPQNVMMSDYNGSQKGFYFSRFLNYTASDKDITYSFTYNIDGIQYESETTRMVLKDTEGPSAPSDVKVGYYNRYSYHYYGYQSMSLDWKASFDNAYTPWDKYIRSYYVIAEAEGQALTNQVWTSVNTADNTCHYYFYTYYSYYNWYIYPLKTNKITVIGIDGAGNLSQPSEPIYFYAW